METMLGRTVPQCADRYIRGIAVNRANSYAVYSSLCARTSCAPSARSGLDRDQCKRMF